MVEQLHKLVEAEVDCCVKLFVIGIPCEVGYIVTAVEDGTVFRLMTFGTVTGAYVNTARLFRDIFDVTVGCDAIQVL